MSQFSSSISVSAAPDPALGRIARSEFRNLGEQLDNPNSGITLGDVFTGLANGTNEWSLRFCLLRFLGASCSVFGERITAIIVLVGVFLFVRMVAQIGFAVLKAIFSVFSTVASIGSAGASIAYNTASLGGLLFDDESNKAVEGLASGAASAVLWSFIPAWAAGPISLAIDAVSKSGASAGSGSPPGVAMAALTPTGLATKAIKAAKTAVTAAPAPSSASKAGIVESLLGAVPSIIKGIFGDEQPSRDELYDALTTYFDSEVADALADRYFDAQDGRGL